MIAGILIGISAGMAIAAVIIILAERNAKKQIQGRRHDDLF